MYWEKLHMRWVRLGGMSRATDAGEVGDLPEAASRDVTSNAEEGTVYILFRRPSARV
jgi:hypothetical protein